MKPFTSTFRHFSLLAVLTLSIALTFVSASGSRPTLAQSNKLVISAIPDQDPDKLARLYKKVSDYLSQELGVPVEYKPVQDYAAAVTAFKVGDLQLVWFGGLTGVQARLQVPGAQAIVQRDIDATFHSVFIANKEAGIKPFDSQDGLTALKGHTLTFGSEISTSGRLMPQYFLSQAGVKIADLKGKPGFSGSHDATIKLVQAGTYDVGVLNEQVWAARVADKSVDTSEVFVIWRTPAFFDYHWLVRPEVDQTFGTGFTQKITDALLKLDVSVPAQKDILDLFGAKKFIVTKNENYAQIEAVGRDLGLIVDNGAPAATTSATAGATVSATTSATSGPTLSATTSATTAATAAATAAK